jgi:hypothetical protein
MPSATEYAAATKAVLKAVNADIQAEVPAFIQSQLPTDKIAAFAAQVAKAAVDAAEQARSDG